MADLKLTTALDLDFTTGDLQLLTGTEAIKQEIGIRMRFFLGEWYLNTTLGVPWYSKILGKKDVNIPTGVIPVARNIFAKVIRTTPGILEISQLDVEIDGPTRVMSVVIQATTTTDNDNLDYSEEFTI